LLVEIDRLNATLTWKHRTAPGVYQATEDVSTYTVTAEPTDPSAAPTDLSATTMSADQIDLGRTDNADNEASFEVERSTDGSDGPFSPLTSLPVDTTAYPDAGLDAGTKYCYRVRATNTGGPSACSSVACAVTETYLTYLALVSTAGSSTFSHSQERPRDTARSR
jgi:hypothetical protein